MSVIYISGYGRSGSTLLELILNKEKGIIGLGELSNFNEVLKNGENCSCGESLHICDFWGPVIKLISKEKNELDVKRLDQSKTTMKIVRYLEDLHDNKIKIVDSSKSTRKTFLRPFIYGSEKNFRLIHIIRNPKDCLISNKRKDNLKSLKGEDMPLRFALLKTIFNYVLANLALGIYRLRFSKKKIMTITYEKLISDFEYNIDQIERFVDLPNGTISRSKAFDNSAHLIRGNRLARKSKIEISSKVPERKSNVYWYESLTLGVFCFPIYYLIRKT